LTTPSSKKRQKQVFLWKIKSSMGRKSRYTCEPYSIFNSICIFSDPCTILNSILENPP
jgi:predicted aconitase